MFGTSTEAPNRPPLTRVGVWVREKDIYKDVFFQKLHRQNVNLNVSGWTLYNAARSGKGHYLALGVPERTLDRIMLPYKVYYSTDTLVFTLKGPVKK